MLPLRLVNSERNAGRRGIIMLMFTLSFVFVILVVGLAIDAGLLYVVKTKLQAAADAAALAAARSLNTSLTSTAQTTDAQNAATAFFNANLPSGYLNTSGSSVSTGLAYGTGNNLNTVFVTTTSSTNAPAYFMRWFGYGNVPITVTGTASRRDINVIIVLDISASMNNTQPGTSSTACSLMKSAAVSFISQFSNLRDTIGVVTFNDGATSYPATTNFNPSMVTTINGLSCTGDTNTAAGLHAAYSALQTLNNSTKLNVVVLFTDGWAETLTADFPVKMATDTRYGDGAGGTSTGTLTSVAPSTCQDNMGRSSGTVGWNPFALGDPGAGATVNTIRAALSENSNDASGPDSTGTTSGPWVYATASGWTKLSGLPSSCSFNSLSTSSFRRDIAYIPTADIYGNSTSGYRTDYNGTTGTYVTGQDEFSSGTYMGRIRPDQPVTLFNVGFNTAEAQAVTIRSNTTLNPMILTIGLGGNSTFAADAEFLIRLANVPSGTSPGGTTITNSIYSTSQAQGLYVYSPSSSQLSNAFQKVASFLVELSH